MAPSTLLDHALEIRLAAYLLVLVLMAGWEWYRPLRSLALPRTLRWPGNLAIAALGALLVRLVLPMGVIGVAEVVAARDVGLLNQLPLPPLPGAIVAVVLLDLGLYLQHVLVHAVPLLWRLHRMHHADLDFDVTTGARFHPLEILLSFGLKCALVTALGAPPVAVLAFELLLNASSMFNHGNVALPRWLETSLRLVLVTPAMHRVHHSAQPLETNSNFGFALSLWDRLCGTYRAAPVAGHLGMTIGLTEFRAPGEEALLPMLLQPLRAGARGYDIGSRA